MEYPKNPAASGPLARQLSNLKLISRLLGHELHAQTGSKAISLSRDEVQEIQTTIDLFIEEVTRWQGGGASAGGGLGAAETRMVGNRN
jgi:hypothetical protein